MITARPAPHARRRRRPRSWLTALAGSLLVLAVVLPAAPAQARPGTGAAAAPAKPAPDRLTFGVQPSGPKKPDARPYFVYAATSRALLRDHLAISNLSSRPLMLRVYASDAFNTPQGGFDVRVAGAKSTDVGAWIRLPVGSVRVPARGRVIVPFRLSVPANARPGDHAGGIVASLRTTARDAKGNPVLVDQRVGARVYLRVAGPLNPHLSVEQMAASYRATANPAGCGQVNTSYTVRNDGNVRLGGRQAVSVKPLLGPTARADRLPDVPELLPGNAITLTATVRCVRPGVWLTAITTVDPIPAPGQPTPPVNPVRAQSRMWALPWVILGAVLLAGLWLYLRWRRRRPRQPVTQPPRTPVGVGAAAEPASDEKGD